MKSLATWFLLFVVILAALVIVVPAFASSAGQGEQPPTEGEAPLDPPTIPAEVFKTAALLAWFVERLLQPVKKLWQAQPNQQVFDTLANNAVALLFCLSLDLNLYAAAGLEATQPWANKILVILSAPLVASGSSLIHDLTTYIAGLRETGQKTLAAAR